MAYPVLVGEMAKKKVTKKALSEALDLHRNAISYKLDTPTEPSSAISRLSWMEEGRQYKQVLPKHICGIF